MKRTLLVTTDYPPKRGGVARYCSQVAAGFAGQPFWVLTVPDAQAVELDHVIRRSLFFQHLWPHWLKGVFAIRRVCKQLDIEQVIVGQLLPVGNMLFILSSLFRTSFIVQLHGMDLLQANKYPLKRWVAKRVLSRAQNIIVNSEVVASLLHELYGEDLHAEVVHPIPEQPQEVDPQTVEHLRQTYGLDGRPVILTVGRLVKRKGVDQTMGAMLHVWQKYPQALYVVIGSGPELPALKKMAAPNQQRVLFLDHCDDREKSAWYQLCDLFVMPARESSDDVEGFGMVFLEANWFSKPVVGGRTGGITEAVLDGQTGILVDSENVDEIAQAMLQLLDDRDLARRLGEQGRSRLEDGELWEKSLNHLRSVLS